MGGDLNSHELSHVHSHVSTKVMAGMIFIRKQKNKSLFIIKYQIISWFYVNEHLYPLVFTTIFPAKSINNNCRGTQTNRRALNDPKFNPNLDGIIRGM